MWPMDLKALRGKDGKGSKEKSFPIVSGSFYSSVVIFKSKKKDLYECHINVRYRIHFYNFSLSFYSPSVYGKRYCFLISH